MLNFLSSKTCNRNWKVSELELEFRIFLLRSLQNYYGKCFFFKFLTYNIIFFVEIVIELDEMVYVFSCL